MRADDIKRYLKPYSMAVSRTTTVNNAFASALAPSDSYDARRVREAMEYLGQNPLQLVCVYCRQPAETWDHLVGLVKNSQLRGYGHQLGNLVPCCKGCNGRKGSKDWKEFLSHAIPDPGRRSALRERLAGYLQRFARPIDVGGAAVLEPEAWRRYEELRHQVIALLKEADAVAAKLRPGIVPADV